MIIALWHVVIITLHKYCTEVEAIISSYYYLVFMCGANLDGSYLEMF